MKLLLTVSALVLFALNASGDEDAFDQKTLNVGSGDSSLKSGDLGLGDGSLKSGDLGLGDGSLKSGDLGSGDGSLKPDGLLANTPARPQHIKNSFGFHEDKDDEAFATWKKVVIAVAVVAFVVILLSVLCCCGVLSTAMCICC